MFPALTVQADFLADQKKYERVRISIKEKQQTIEARLKENNLEVGDFNLLMVAYKDENLLELYAKNRKDATYTKIHSYRICSRSEIGRAHV